MEVYRCRFCGETHLGLGPLTNCPFCGAHDKYMVKIEEWQEENKDVEVNVSKENLDIALDVEIGNASFYKAAAANARSSVSQGIFKRLSKVENEHAEVIAKLLNIDLPDLIDMDDMGSDESNFEESYKRESKAIEHYTKSYAIAEEPRVKEVFFMLTEIEKDHLALDKAKLGK